MAEPFKNVFNPEMLAAMGKHFHSVDPKFNRDRFVETASDGLDQLELKARSQHIQSALDSLLPDDFRSACELMLASLSPKTDDDWLADDIFTLGISGWAVMPMAEIVTRRGMADFDYAMDVLAQMSKRFTSEFAVRPFFIANQKQAVAIARKWALDENYHVRRLASEGSRPRLPWGLRLKKLVDDPKPLLPLLESLRDDPSEYVRRSVANSLNDISKDHPDTVAQVAGDWITNASIERKRLVKHACRSLIKSGHKPTLIAFGYGKPKLAAMCLELDSAEVCMGESLGFSVLLKSSGKANQSLMIDYVVHHLKANGKTTTKTFKWKAIELAGGESVTLSKSHKFVPITTRVYYEGEHSIEIQINGVSFGRESFNLKLQE